MNIGKRTLLAVVVCLVASFSFAGTAAEVQNGKVSAQTVAVSWADGKPRLSAVPGVAHKQESPQARGSLSVSISVDCVCIAGSFTKCYLTASASGGTGSYSYQWDCNGSTSSVTAHGFSGGSSVVCVTVTSGTETVRRCVFRSDACGGPIDP